MLARIARLAYRRRRWVLVGWVVLVFGLFTLGGVAGGKPRTESELPGSDRQAAVDIMTKGGSGVRTGDSGMIVFRAAAGVDDPAEQRAMEVLFERVGAIDGVSVWSPYDEGSAQEVSTVEHDVLLEGPSVR